jgi:hypothetical protein
MVKFENVIIFGDSLSDIGHMLDSNLSLLRHLHKLSWTNQEVHTEERSWWQAQLEPILHLHETGRFSDCRNWTDYMITETSNTNLIDSTIQKTRSLSQPFQSFTDYSLLCLDNEPFRYANYAVGGACGFTPYSNGERLALTTFDDEISNFESDYKKLGKKIEKKNFLFIIWFGANDIYTANRPAIEMEQVAEHMTGPCRDRILRIIGKSEAKFVYVNLGLPLSATRYANMKSSNEERYKERVKAGTPEKDPLPANDFKIRQIINNLTSGAQLFNHKLLQCTRKNKDLYVDMCHVIRPETMQRLSKDLKVRTGSQPPGSIKTFYTPQQYRARFYDQPCQYMRDGLSSDSQPLEFMTLEDHVHPTDHIYGLMWTVIKIYLRKAEITFGDLDNDNKCTSAVTKEFVVDDFDEDGRKNLMRFDAEEEDGVQNGTQ